ncbi:glycosyltransferase [bacterium]|nr:glycosyltransferase [bacterium]
MDKILISVIVPAYNEEKFIGACISSLEKQNFNKDDYEIIVIDNGSTDNTVQIVHNFNKKFLPGFAPSQLPDCGTGSGEESLSDQYTLKYLP